MKCKRKFTRSAVLSTVAFTAMIGTPAMITDAAIVFSGTTTVQGELRITTPTQLTDLTTGGALNNATVILEPTTLGSSFNLTGINPSNLVIGNNNVGTLTVSPGQTITVLPGVLVPIVIGGGIISVGLPQVAPTNLNGFAPTMIGIDGKITGTTLGMEYRLKGIPIFIPVLVPEIINLVPGTYEVRFAAKPGYAAGAITQVIIPAYAGPPAVLVTGIALDKPVVADLEIGSGAIEAKKTVQLNATVAPVDASDKTVTWTSSNPAVATVSNTGFVTAVGAGSTTITATTANGKTATSEITVTSKTAVLSPILTGTALTPALIEFSFTDDPVWRGKITEVSVDGKYPSIHLSRVTRTVAGKITIDNGLNLTPGEHEFIFKAEGYADVVVTVNVVAPSTPPSITSYQAILNGAVVLNFEDNADWRNKITGVYRNGVQINEYWYNRSVAGQVRINTVPTSGTFTYVIKAQGYSDVTVSVMVPEPSTPPTITSHEASTSGFTLNFEDNADWRSKIKGLSINGATLSGSSVNKTVAGQAKINLSYGPGTYTVVIKAEGYSDVTVMATIPDPPTPSTPPMITSYQAILNGAVVLNFEDNADWRNKITGVYRNGVQINEYWYNRSVAGEVRINTVPAPGTYTYVIKSEGYSDVTVIVTVPEPSTPPTIISHEASTSGFTLNFDDNADWRSKINGVNINGANISNPSSFTNKTLVGQVKINLGYGPGTYTVVIKAEGYADVTITAIIPTP